VHIDGKDKTSRFNSLSLKQSLNSCCDFELVETIATRKTLWQEQSQELLKQVGKNVIIRLSFPRGENTFQFSGFITEVVIDSDTPTQGGSENKISFIGKGSPVVLDDAPSMNSFVENDLKNIVETVFKNKYFDLTCNPKFKGIIPYAMQYKESRWNFLNRLSAIYNELLYFDGSKLVFGEVAGEQSEDLTIDEDITEFKVSSKTLPFKYTLYNYNAEDDEYIHSDTEEEVRPRNTYTQNVFQDPENLYSQRGMLSAEVPTPLAGDTARLQQSKYQQALGKMHCVEGKTHNSLVRLGSLIYVKFPSGFEKENMGEYRVISVEHCVDRDDYYNRFVAVPLGMEYPLYEPQTIAYPEIAEVVANDDPKKQGRVQVRFFWQRHLGEQTSWLRVQTPDAGVLTDNSSNRGFQFIPEVGDQVMVSFEQGNPHRPYVSGSMYHGKNAKEVSNNIRSITTKSGSTIVFDDTDRAEKITIKDKKGNTITFDSKDKSLSLQSPETINISAKNVKINAQENVEITAEKDIITHSKSETVINSEVDIDLVSQKNISLQSEERMTLRSDNTLAIEAQNKATLRADTTLLQGDSLTELSGERIKLKGESLAELMARLVKIN
jgi:phage-related baseplate assembly protein